jgi:hypothetical protein
MKTEQTKRAKSVRLHVIRLITSGIIDRRQIRAVIEREWAAWALTRLDAVIEDELTKSDL